MELIIKNGSSNVISGIHRVCIKSVVTCDFFKKFGLPKTMIFLIKSFCILTFLAMQVAAFWTSRDTLSNPQNLKKIESLDIIICHNHTQNMNSSDEQKGEMSQEL